MDILELVEDGARLVAAHDDPRCLRRSAEQFLRVYARYAGYGVIPASPQAERVLGAAMMLDPDLVVGANGASVILDVTIASGTLIARTARRLRDSGNSARLVGIALTSLVAHPGHRQIEEVDELVVIRDQSRIRFDQDPQRGDRSVALAR